MGNRRFAMHQYRHIFTRIRLGDSDRQIAKAKLMGRNKVAELRKVAEAQGWLNPKSDLPNDEELAQALSRTPGFPTQSSSIDPFAKEMKGWVQQGVSNVVILRALQEKHGFAGSYSAVRRFVRKLNVESVESGKRAESALK